MVRLSGVSVELIEVVTNILSVPVAETVGIATKSRRPVRFRDRVVPPAVVDHVRIVMGGTEHVAHLVRGCHVVENRCDSTLTLFDRSAGNAAVDRVAG